MATKPTPLYIISRILKLLGLLLLTSIFGLLFWRVCISTIIPREIKRLQVNDSLVAAYKAHGDKLEMFRQSVPDISREEHNYGYFSVVDYAINPEASQVQVIFRYNHSTIEKLAEYFEFSGFPGAIPSYLSCPSDHCARKFRGRGRQTLKTGSDLASKVVGTTLLYNYRQVVFRG